MQAQPRAALRAAGGAGLRRLLVEPIVAQHAPGAASSCWTGQSHAVLAACDVTLIASGTATLEAALFKRPMVIAYTCLAELADDAARMAYQPWVGLPNILCRDFVVPELLQDDCHARKPWPAEGLALAGRPAPPHRAAAALHRPAPQLLRQTPRAAPPMPSRKSFKPEQLGLGWATPGLVAGVDEAGRGPLAGPVVAAAVILDDLKPIRGLADSKTLSARKRDACSTRSAPRRCAAASPRPASRRSTGSTSCRPRCWPCSAPWRACACCRTWCWSTATACRC
jgi:hypothetical protein